MISSVIENILQHKIIAIFRGIDEEKQSGIAQALYEGGIRLAEVAFDNSGSVDEKHTARQIERLRVLFDGRMTIGAGSVIRRSQAEAVRCAGGEFIISPNTDRAVIERTLELGMVSIPGALTPSEVQTASEYGAHFVKVFPVSPLGAGYIKALSAPLPHVKLLAVGGINEHNLSEYLTAGACGAGIGSDILKDEYIKIRDYKSIKILAEKYVNIIKCGG